MPKERQFSNEDYGWLDSRCREW